MVREGWLTLHEAAARRGMSKRTLWRRLEGRVAGWLREGRLCRRPRPGGRGFELLMSETAVDEIEAAQATGAAMHAARCPRTGRVRRTAKISTRT